ncbi:MAG TPA: hypothetical protein VK837_06825 [Longimicrobiales bacterium]|nr:hypothetical protein [Longimicrobiales bacterium]
MNRSAPVLFAALAVAVSPCAAQAQTVPFGKNKIQYVDFDWQVLEGEHVDVYYYPEEEEIARLTLAYAEESYAFLERKFQHHPFRRIPLIVYASDQHFEQTNIFPGFIPEGVLGFTEYLKRRIALPFRGDYDQFRQTLRHELVHSFQLSKIEETQRAHPRVRRPTPQRIHWFTEGLGEFWSGEQDSTDDFFIRDLVLNGRVPTIRQFSASYSFASYPLGAELHKYLAARFGEDYIVRVYEDFWKYQTFDQALESILGIDLEVLSREWKYELEQRHFPLYADRAPLEVAARPVITDGANYMPTIWVPQGDSVPRLLFFSPRTGYTNLYLTDLRRGERGVRTVLEGERSAEFERLHERDSRIDVNDDGVVAMVSRYLERDALILYDLADREIVGRYQWPDLVGINSPAWSPDGERVVFEALSTSGISDLYVLDFEAQERTALTQDRYMDEDPDWSPDGREIVFVSDRTPFGRTGSRNLFLYDVEAGEVRYLTYGSWIDRGPRWSNDGTRVVFSSDRGGIFDLYTVDREGTGRRVSTMAGAALEPHWLPDDEGVVFSGYSNGRLRIYEYRFQDEAGSEEALVALSETPEPEATDAPPAMLTPLAPRGLVAVAAAVEGATVAGDSSRARPEPPVEGTGASNGARGPEAAPVAAAPDSLPIGWAWEDLGAPAVESADRRPYRSLSSIGLDFAGGSGFIAPGVGSAQGAQFLLSDMLGDHILFAGISAVQADDFDEFLNRFSGSLLYLNLGHRLNYGAGLFRFSGLFQDVSLNIFEEDTYGGYFLASYPFSRFSRVELQLGLENSHRTDIDDLFDRGLSRRNTREDTRDLTRSGLLTTNVLSYVKDNTLWLPSGPIDGERYAISIGLTSCFSCTTRSTVTENEVTRSAVGENYSVILDYRRYIRTTLRSAWALRGYAYYSDGEIPGRAVLGGPHAMRGYPRFSMAGSRVWLLNQEWRFPILDGVALGFPFGTIRLPGVQGGIFSDIGQSWVEGQEPEGTWGSYGLGLRTSLGGALVLRWDIGRRFRIGDLPPVRFDLGEDFNDTFVDFFFGYNF